jgi:hypothetical protein
MQKRIVEHLIDSLEASEEAKESLRFRLAMANSTEILFADLSQEQMDALLVEWIRGEVAARSRFPSDLTEEYTRLEMIIRLLFRQALERATLFRPAVMERHVKI